MSYHLEVISVFVASPSDVKVERERLEDVVSAVNREVGKPLGLRLELIKWETHTRPAFGDDSQAVINAQIKDDYDVFIGILWHRYGTPTKRDDSGTKEEFSRAKDRHAKSPSSIEMMMYFKDGPVNPSEIDEKQLAKVKAFKSEVQALGLYSEFSDVDEFANLTRIHLGELLRDWKSRDATVPPKIAVNDEQKTAHDTIKNDDTANIPSVDDLGIFEHMDIAEESLAKIRELFDAIGSDLDDHNLQINLAASSLDSLEVDQHGNKPRNKARRIISEAAGAMTELSSRIRSKLPDVEHHLETGISSLIRALELSGDFASDADGKEDAAEAVFEAQKASQSIQFVKQQTQDLRDTISGLPRMTTELNRAKKELVSVLNDLVRPLTSGERLLEEASKVISSKISDSD